MPIRSSRKSALGWWPALAWGVAVSCQFATGETARAVRWYVANDGNDAWSGRLAEPNQGKTDGPFASITRARDAIRQLKAQAGLTTPVEVLLRGGTHCLREPFLLGPEDSGTEACPVTYQAYPGERPVLSGGRSITGWRKGDGPLWTATVPEVREGKWHSNQLFVNGQRRTRARHPNEGFLRSDGPPRFTDEQREAIVAANANRKINFKADAILSKFGLRYRKGDIQRWGNLDDVTLHVMHAWTSGVHWIASLDEDHRTVRFTGPSRFPSSHFERQMPYFVEHVREALDAPGEWYLDRKTGVLTYSPQANEDMGASDAVLSVLKQLVRFKGEPEMGLFVEWLTFRGLSFQHADWGPLDRAWENDGFSSVHFLDAAVGGAGLRHCVFDRCEITRCGGYGLYLLAGSAFNRVQQCEIHDVGGGGILIGSRWSPYETYGSAIPPDDAPTDQLAHHNVVDNCFIHGGGKVFFGVVGVFVAHAPHNTLRHNEICDMPYTGIAVGRRLDYKFSHARHNTVEFNHIHHLGNGVMSDMAGVYTEGISPGTRIRHNFIHDVNHYRYGAWGLYCDQASSGIELDHNLCLRCMAGGYMQNVGVDNVVRNNVFAFNAPGQPFSSGRWKPGLTPTNSMSIVRNIIQTDTGEVLGYHWSKEDKFRFDFNLYWTPANVALRFKEWTWDEWRAMGQDAHSVIADPLFVNAAGGDFRLRPGSPAEKLGFEPIDVSAIGLYGEADWAARPRGLTFKPFAPIAPPPPDQVEDDFEDTPVGQKADGAVTFGEGQGASIRVTGEAAAPGGRRSLKFTDAPGLSKPHWPWLAYQPKASGVTAKLSFDLRVDKGSLVWHEWRTPGAAYKIGPSIQVANGQVKVGSRALTTLPLGAWVRVEITSPIKAENDGVYEMSLSGPDGRAQRFSGLPFGSGKEFTELGWLGFVSLAETRAVFYIDNIRLEPSR